MLKWIFSQYATNCLCVDNDFNSVETYDFKDTNILILDNTLQTINKGSEKEKQKEMRKRHGCEYCKSTFCTKTVLRNHINSVHLKIKPYKCENCEKYFAKKYQLTRHDKALHQKLKPSHKEIPERWLCDLCDSSFSMKFYLKCHINRVHLGKDYSVNR